MKILFDVGAMQPYGSVKNHGGGEYGFLVLESLVRKASGRDNIFAVFFEKKELQEKYKEFCAANKIKMFGLESKYDIPRIIDELSIDTFYSPVPYDYYDVDFPENVRFIGTIHGLRSMEFLQHEYLIGLTNKLRKKFRLYLKRFESRKIKEMQYIRFKRLFLKMTLPILTDSNYSKYYILSQFKELNANDILVCYPPVKKCDLPEGSVLNIVDVNKKFFLLISINRPEKNGLRSVLSLDKFFSLKGAENFYAICIGDDKPAYLDKISNKDKFKFLKYVSDQELEYMYKTAFCFIYPSLNEGFGYPPIEAMKYGTPVIASACTSIPEVCGDAVEYFNPLSSDELVAKLLFMAFEGYLLFDNKIKNRISQIYTKQNEDIELIIDLILNQI